MDVWTRVCTWIALRSKSNFFAKKELEQRNQDQETLRKLHQLQLAEKRKEKKHAVVKGSPPDTIPLMQLNQILILSYHPSSVAPVALVVPPSQPAFSQPAFRAGQNRGTFRRFSRGDFDMNSKSLTKVCFYMWSARSHRT